VPVIFGKPTVLSLLQSCLPSFQPVRAGSSRCRGLSNPTDAEWFKSRRAGTGAPSLLSQSGRQHRLPEFNPAVLLWTVNDRDPRLS